MKLTIYGRDSKTNRHYKARIRVQYAFKMFGFSWYVGISEPWGITEKSTGARLPLMDVQNIKQSVKAGREFLKMQGEQKTIEAIKEMKKYIQDHSFADVML